MINGDNICSARREAAFCLKRGAECKAGHASGLVILTQGLFIESHERAATRLQGNGCQTVLPPCRNKRLAPAI